MRVSDVMTDSVKTVPPTMKITQAADLMKGNRMHHLAVVDGTELVGIVSSRDLDSLTRRKKTGGETVNDVLTRGVTTVTPATPVRRAANVMRGQSIGSLVVMSGGRVVGIVTVSDLLALLGEGDLKPVSQGKRWTLKHRVPHVRKASSSGKW